LIGYWANTYPVKYIHTRILDILFMVSKSVDLKGVLVTDDNVNKFLKGLYLFIKAFPKLSEEMVNYINSIKVKIDAIITGSHLSNDLKKKLDRMYYFIEISLIKSDYYNKNTMFIKV
jgi:hypothetical protein